MPPRLVVVVSLLLAVVLLVPSGAAGHAEREASFPDGTGTTPKLLTARTAADTLLVCKRDSRRLFSALPTKVRDRNQRLYRRCMADGFRNIQAAVDAVRRRNSRILVLPGVYEELPSRRAHAAGCGNLDGGSNGDGRGTPSILTYEQQRQCPHVQNLVAIFGDRDGDRDCDLPQCGLQIQGTGRTPTDVVLDGGFTVLNGIRADRADGVRFANFTVQRFEFNALYVLETDGFRIHNMLGRWNDEYAYLTFAVDHGLYSKCEGYGNGDSAIYPGSASDINSDRGHDVGRYAVEVRNCHGHHNALGYSGTAGNSVHVHDSRFDHNQTGLATDSLFPGHPGLPQDHAFFSDNVIHGNNRNYVQHVQDGDCDGPFLQRGYEHGVVCPVIPAPIGTGLLIAGGNYNKISGNRIFDNWRSGTYQIWVPAILRDEPDPTKQTDTSHHNRYRRNRLGFGPGGLAQPNGVDFWWDDQGEGNCWDDNTPRSGVVTHNATDPRGLPDCASPSVFPGANPVKQSQIASCATYDRRGSDEERDPPGCDFFRMPDRPAARQPRAPVVRRTRGASNTGTAVGVSRRVFRQGSKAAVIAPVDRPAAALVAAPLAGEVSGPLLLTRRNRLTRRTADEIRRLDAKRVYLVGKMNPAVRRTLRDVGVRRIHTIAGRNRYQTAARVARRMGGTEVYVARGASKERPRSAHAYGIASLAASQQRPILLSRGGRLPRATGRVLRAMDIVNATLFGGKRRLAPRVAKAVRARVPVTDRVAAHKRYSLSSKAASLGLQGIADESRLWVVNGRSSLDAIVAATAVARRGGVALSVHGRNLDGSPAARRWLTDHQADLRLLTMIGGPRRVSERTAAQIRDITH